MKIKSKDRKLDRQHQLRNSKLLPCHQKALLKCRDYLQQTLKPDFLKSVQIKERTSSFGKFSSISSTTPSLSLTPNSIDPQQRDFDNKCERISVFLDQLEVSDEKTFATFMDALKEQNRSVYKILEKTIKLFEHEDMNDEDYDEEFRELGESSTLSGYAVLEILKQQKFRNSLQSIDEDHLLENVNENNVHLLNNYLDEKDYHLNCFVVASRPEYRNKPWIKHDDNKRKRMHDTDNSNNVNIMFEATKDIVFKTIQRSSLPINIKKPCETIEKIYIIDEQSVYSPSKIGKNDRYLRKDDFRGRYGSKKCISGRTKNYCPSNPNPPPLPPKPDVLTPIPVVKIRERSRCNINRNSNHNNQNNLTITNIQNAKEAAPPIPLRQKMDSFSKPPPALPISICRNESAKSSENSRLWSNDSNVSAKDRVVSDDTDDYDCNDGDDDDDDDSDDDDENINLNYIIEPEDTDEMEEPYEPITPMLPARKRIDGTDHSKTQVEDNYKKETFVNVDEGGNVISSTNPDNDHDDNKLTTNGICQSDKSENGGENLSPLKSIKKSPNEDNIENNYIDVIENKNASASIAEELITNGIESNDIDETTKSNENSETKLFYENGNSPPTTETDKVYQTQNEKTSDGSVETLTTTTVSVSRSSSGVSATVSDQTTTRDSGVDSTISHSLHDSPFCVSDLIEDLDTVIPNSSTFNGNEKLEFHGRQNDTSYYEDIDSMNPRDSTTYTSSHYLDPRSENPTYSEKVKGNSDQKVITVGTLLLSNFELVLTTSDIKMLESGNDTANNTASRTCLKQFQNTFLAYDQEGFAYYVPKDCLKKHGDPKNEPWFYPIPLTVKEATIFLNHESQRGCFVVYNSDRSTDESSDECLYYLSVCKNSEGEVYHYPIVENVRGDITIEGSDRSFLNVSELINFYKTNRDNLVTRLRRPLKESKLPIIPGYHYPAHFEVSKKSIRLFGEIISKSKFGVTCKGNYGHQIVIVKALQHHLITENEDDFLEEALILMKLNHENIAKLLGVCFRNRPYYIIMENLNCGTLQDALNNGVIQTGRPELQIDLCLQVVTAMVYLEKMHFLLHRNLKSSNFLIGSDYTIKLFNFEKAKLVDDDCYRAAPIDEISVRWSPPEVFLHSLYSTKSDVWSAGVVMWEIFSMGQLPYNQLAENEVIVYVSEKGKLEKPLDCDNRMFSIINQCWKYKPETRPSFETIEKKLKGQSNIYYETNPHLRPMLDTPTLPNVRSESNWSDSMQSTNLVLPIKPSKRHSHSGPVTPVVLTPALTLRNNTLQSCENDSKIDDIMRSLNSNNKQGNRHAYLLNSRPNANFETSSVNVPYAQAINGESRDNKIRKSLRKFLKKGNLNIKNSY